MLTDAGVRRERRAERFGCTIHHKHKQDINTSFCVLVFVCVCVFIVMEVWVCDPKKM